MEQSSEKTATYSSMSTITHPFSNFSPSSSPPSSHSPNHGLNITTCTNTINNITNDHNYSHSLPSPVSAPPPPPPPAVVISPCAACKILRRRCAEKCVLAPYFPPTEPYKFTIAHRVFGASNIIKFLQELPETQRADAVSSMVYEASARIRDPVYGCAGAISQLQKQVSELQAQLAKAQAEVVNMQCQQANLIALICMEMRAQPQEQPLLQHQYMDTSCFLDEGNLGTSWEPLWT